LNPERLLAHYEQIADAPDSIGRLRRFILDLAVRGKLVPQDPKDEPASELLKRIAEEKAKLAKAGKLKKTVIEPVTSNADDPIELPTSWAWECLGDVVQYGSSAKVQSNKDISEDSWVLDLEDIEKDTSRLIERVPSSARVFRSTKTVFERGDVLFGKLRPYLNKILVADQDGVCTTEIIPIRGYCGLVPEYVRLVLKSPLTMARVDRLMYGMKMPRLGTGDAVKLSFPLPPLAEQHRIVAKVDELMALCDRLEAARAEREATRDRLAAASLARLNAPDPETFQDGARFVLKALPALTTRPDQIKQLRQTILNLAVRGKLVPQDPNDEPASELLKRIEVEKARLVKAGKLRRTRELETLSDAENLISLPNGWKVTRLGNAFDVRDGTHDTPKYVDVGFPLITSKNLSSGFLSFADVKLISKQDHQQISERSKVDQGDVLLAMIGSIGNPVIVDTNRLFSIKNVALFKYYDPSLSNSGFLRYFLQYAANQMKELAAGGLQPFVSLGFLRAYPVAIPPLAEQHRIVAKVDELMDLCDQLEASLSDTATTRRRLLGAVLAEALEPAEVREVEAVA